MHSCEDSVLLSSHTDTYALAQKVSFSFHYNTVKTGNDYRRKCDAQSEEDTKKKTKWESQGGEGKTGKAKNKMRPF
ncbi:hypothetical protein POVCU2_0035630 [Plasmodium ovale curtisi]|uniref:Uncharacterized protein n=1 Tax=Plasmodium ovale curtisi TaxID=864141 RepID=A0A1A8W083_PLAOA|nr:hypothetical protein POVCU2_0035630 [Plasmodium ovale curtisi]